MPRLFILLVIASTSARGDDASKSSDKNPTIKDNLQKLRSIVMDKLKAEPTQSARKAKSYGYYPYLPNVMNYNNYNYPDMGYYFPQGKTPVPQEWRTEPFKRKPSTQLMDSPIYYVRLPPSPYVFVPGMGFVSRPPSLNEPGLLESAPDKLSASNGDAGDLTQEDFLHVPIDFVSNGKPTSIYQLPNDQPKPKPQNPLYNLDKGPYLFNGKPIELYVLQNAYNNLYADALTNFYP